MAKSAAIYIIFFLQDCLFPVREGGRTASLSTIVTTLWKNCCNMNAYTLKLEPLFQLALSKFYQFCCQNQDIQFERNAQGEIIILSPTGGETGKTNFNLALKIGIWNERTKLGVCFDSSTCFRLPNGAERSPDVSWVAQSRWDKLTLEEKTKFPPLAPDFVLELMSPSDRLKDTQEKMKEYRSNIVDSG